MRVAADTRQLDVDPGATAAVVLDVVNTQAVIDGVSARVIGLPQECVTASPVLLPLFPAASGQLTLSLAVPPTHPAGRHPLTVEVISHGAQLPAQYLDLEIDVAARPALRLGARPRLVRARRGARFVLELINDGNVPLEVTLQAADADRSTTTQFTPDHLQIAPGAVAPVLLHVRGPRMFTGADIDRPVTVEAAARRIDLRPDVTADALELPPQSLVVQLRQRPLISRGLLTALVLAGIVALWAGVFLLGLSKVFSGDPMTKQAPASFFTAAGSADGSSAGDGSHAGTAPAGALSKTGQLPPGLGGQIQGTVVSVADGQPVGRILVHAMRQGRTKLEQVSAAATQSDGTFALGGLFPTTYFLEFTAPGYRDTWFRGGAGSTFAAVSSAAGPSPVTVAAQGSVTGLTVGIVGLPATITGTVAVADNSTPPPVTVTARPLLGGRAGAPLKTVTTDGGGKYSLAPLPSPATYELSFTATGYHPTTLVETVGGQDKRLEPVMTLGAAAGQISGTVVDGRGRPLGGATVTTTVAGKTLTILTPTTGQVGSFVLPNLITPGTYVVSFSAPGHGSATEIQPLPAGKSKAGLTVRLANGTTSLTGHVQNAQHVGLGGVTVTVGGTGGLTTAPETTTLTGAAAGDYIINGLPPGAYTVTFSLPGYAATSAPAVLTGDSQPQRIDVTLISELGEIDGVVLGATGDPFGGATVTATDGQQTWHTTTGSTDGSYVLSGLPPGTYSVTATAAKMRQQTAIVTISSGVETAKPLHLRPVGG